MNAGELFGGSFMRGFLTCRISWYTKSMDKTPFDIKACIRPGKGVHSHCRVEGPQGDILTIL